MSKPMLLEEWVKKYEEKTNDKFMLPKGFQLCYLPERGFCQFKIDKEGKMLMIYQTCGDARFWHDVGELICHMNGLNCIGTICTVHFEAYARIFGWAIENVENVNNQKRYTLKDSIGRKLIATHKHFDEKTGEPCYWVTHYLHERV